MAQAVVMDHLTQGALLDFLVQGVVLVREVVVIVAVSGSIIQFSEMHLILDRGLDRSSFSGFKGARWIAGRLLHVQ